ncbi:bacteriohemerythrin [Hyphomicrobium sp.]|uniref:bacteriohemerythrin n=1 Tax=Hyphomicrobium sp. TaxID=82 RepID=UPI002FE3ACDB
MTMTMTRLIWSDAFLLGFDALDETHREFVSIVDALLTAPDADVKDLLAAFERHAESHFGQEDAWMRETDFPARECHIDEHAAVLKSVREVRELVAEGNLAIARDLAQELAAWFPGHADYLDSALAQWMVKRRFGGAPVVLKRNPLRDG